MHNQGTPQAVTVTDIMAFKLAVQVSQAKPFVDSEQHELTMQNGPFQMATLSVVEHRCGDQSLIIVALHWHQAECHFNDDD